MDLTPYVETIRGQLVSTARAGGEEAAALAELLTQPLEAALRLALQDVLSLAAEEITCDLAPGSVELRLRGREPEFVVTPPPAAGARTGLDGADAGAGRTPVGATPTDDEGGTSRFNLRLPDQLKARVEAAASSEALSINSWVVRALTRTLEGSGQPPARRMATGGQHITGWAR